MRRVLVGFDARADSPQIIRTTRVTGGYALPSMSTIAKATIPVDIPDMWEGRCGSGFDRMDLSRRGYLLRVAAPETVPAKARARIRRLIRILESFV